MMERQAAANCSFPIARCPPRLAGQSQGQDKGFGGARRVRTDDLMLAKHPLYQLSYGPISKAAQSELVGISRGLKGW